MTNQQGFHGTTNLGNTNIYGDISIDNENTEINSSQLKIKDNIITLNSKETSNKVTANISGIEINRGTSDKYNIIFDESDKNLKIGIGKNISSVATTDYVNNAIKEAINSIVNADEIAY